MADEILVADIGGTNARFAMATISKGSIALKNAQVFQAEDFSTLRDAVDAYLNANSAKPKRGCFAAAGPIINDSVDFTNSPWTLRKADIAGPLGLDQFCIVNDFYALAAGVAHLPADAFVDVKPGAPIKAAPQLVVGPGTGFGQALIVPTSLGTEIVSTEGGHVSFAPFNDEEAEVKKYIEHEHSRVSVERLLSGGGLVNIYRALCAIEGASLPPRRASEITEAARSGNDPIASMTVNLFCSVLGDVVGDAVLATGARGGVTLGGGILPKIKDIFLSSNFVSRFLNKGRMSPYVEATPVRIIVTDGAALYGAAASLGNET